MEQLSKQEILDNLREENPHSIPTFKAMDIYAKQTAIAFAEWCVNNHSVEWEGFCFPVWIKHKEYNAEQLYELYHTQSLNK